MSETLEELKAIVNGSPDETTHIDGDKEYVKFIECEMYHYSCEWVSAYDFPLELRSLSEIKRIIELMELLGDISALGFLTESYDSGLSHKKVCEKARELLGE